MIPIMRPVMGDAEEAAVLRVLRSGWITQGAEVAAFEEAFAAQVGAPFACAVSSCTTALHLALLVAGVGPGLEVITASHSFIASANAVRYCGADPVFVDIEPHTFNMDPCLLEQAITARTAAILCVHQMGMPCDLEAILAIAARHGLPVIEDAACAAGSEIRWHDRWEPVGRPHGDIACFSFHPRKVISTGEGGMITTARPDWDERFRRLRQHAMSIPDTRRHAANTVSFESYPEVGYNYRMTDIQAALGREQLKRLLDIVRVRRARAARYGELLKTRPELELPHEPTWARSNWQSFCVRLPAGIDQAAVMQGLLDEGIATRRGIMCAHREPAHGVPDRSAALPVSEFAQDRGLLLPLHHTLTDEEQDHVVSALVRACALD